MSRGVPYAVALVHVPEGGELPGMQPGTWHTPFEAGRYDDPLTAAHLFADSERERGDFGPQALWTVTGNEAAGEIRKTTLMKRMFGDDWEPES